MEDFCGQVCGFHYFNVTTDVTSLVGVGFYDDKANAAWKRLALATPGFYVRNQIGVATMGYMGTKGARGTARYVKAGATDSPKVLKRVRQRELAELDTFDPKAKPPPKSTKTIKVAGKRQNLDDFIDQARADLAAMAAGEAGPMPSPTP